MMRPPAEIGIPLEEVESPALILDLDTFERNLKRLADAGRRLGVRLRPHAKTHKCPVIAKRSARPRPWFSAASTTSWSPTKWWTA